MNKMIVGGGDRCGTLRLLLPGCLLELKVVFALLFVVVHICHSPVGVDVDKPVALLVFNLVDALIDKLNLHEFTVQCTTGGVVSLSTKLA